MSLRQICINEASSLATLSSLLCLLWIAGCGDPPEASQYENRPDPTVDVVEPAEVVEPSPSPLTLASGPSITTLKELASEVPDSFVSNPTSEHAEPLVTQESVDSTPVAEVSAPSDAPADQKIEFAEASQDVVIVENEAVDEFYEELEPFGEWLITDSYGTVWQPANAANTEWRPYSDGTWALADEGWTWVSNEPFGSVCYHYGRWALLDHVGWVWVPGLEWAPAWVAWRADDQYAGWAPLPPEYTTEYIGTETTYWEATSYSPGPLCYNFVPIDYVCSPNTSSHLLSYSVGYDLFQRTHSYTRFYRNDAKRVCNSGPHDRHFRSKEKLKRLTEKQRLLCERTSHRRDHARLKKSGASKSSRGSRQMVSARINRGWPEKESQTAAQRNPRASRQGSSSTSRERRLNQQATETQRARDKGIRKPNRNENAADRNPRRRAESRGNSEDDASRRRQVTAAREKDRTDAIARKRQTDAADEAERSRKKLADARRNAEQEEGRRRQLTAAREKERNDAISRKRQTDAADEAERSRKKLADARRNAEQEEGRRRQLTAAREKERNDAISRKRQAVETERNRKQAEDARRNAEEERSRRQRMEAEKRKADSARKEAQQREQRARDEQAARNRESARKQQEDNNRRREAAQRDRERQQRQAQEQRERDRQAEARRRDDDRKRSEQSSRSSSSSSSRSSSNSGSRSRKR